MEVFLKKNGDPTVYVETIQIIYDEVRPSGKKCVWRRVLEKYGLKISMAETGFLGFSFKNEANDYY